MTPPVIHFDYDFSPYGQKTKLALHAAGVPFQKCDEPAVLPRPNLEALGITYRRIPVMAVGKDVYCDSSLIIETILGPLGGKLQRGPADKAFEVLGSQIFSEMLGLIPGAVLTPDFLKDREAIFPFLTRPDFESLHPSSVAQLQTRLTQIEHETLTGSGPFINGSEISLADVHLVWPIKWAYANLGIGDKEGVGESAFPKVHKWIKACSPEIKPEILSAEKTHELIRGAEYSAKELSIAGDDAYQLKQGEMVNIESFDSTPGSFPQAGKLVGANVQEVVIEVKDGVRVHFPRVGYIVRPQSYKHK